MNLKLKLFQSYYKSYSLLSPKKAGKKAFIRFQTTLKKNIRKRELPFYSEAQEFKVPFDEEDLYCYTLGDKNKPWVILVHGWNSNIASMYAIATSLMKSGKYVICLNLPAHGPSQLKRTNMDICQRAFLSLYDYLQPTQPVSIVSHSFGSVVVSYALSKREIDVDQLVFLTCPNSLEQVFKEFSELIGLSAKGLEHMTHLAEGVLKTKIESLEVAKIIPDLKYNKLNMIHDQYDRVISISDAESIVAAADNAKLIPMKKIGHYRMLWNEEVIETVCQSLN
jgi:pimeloyl-ACP methyl ester carboxylesterase